MKIQIVSHTIAQNADKLMGRWSIVPYYLRKEGHTLDHVLKQDWKNFFKRYNSFKPDVLITVGPIGAIIGLLRRLGMIHVPVVHDWNDNYKELMGAKWGGWLIGLLEYLAIKLSNAVATPSLYRLEKGVHWGKKENKSIFYVPHGAKDHFFKNYTKMKLPGKHKIKLAYVGQISSYKRVDVLIGALKDADLDLILIGKNALGKEYLKYKNVHFIDELPSDKLPKLLVSADYLVVSEDNDSALKIMEYLALEKNILAPRGKIEYLKKDFPSIQFYSSLEDIPTVLAKTQKKTRSKGKALAWSQAVKNYSSILSKIAKR